MFGTGRCFQGICRKLTCGHFRYTHKDVLKIAGKFKNKMHLMLDFLTLRGKFLVPKRKKVVSSHEHAFSFDDEKIDSVKNPPLIADSTFLRGIGNGVFLMSHEISNL
jgi:hypothetical protein